MSTRVVVAGTDTNIGKTVFAAALTQALDGYYWKPVQAGLEGETDSQVVRRLSGLKASRILLEQISAISTGPCAHWTKLIWNCYRPAYTLSYWPKKFRTV